ncbi:MAG: thiamine phosphate synthase [Myxococcales bacterium FL481]|nr:MAG: thiamine phosphate synthase [Myxococcales bacterium FL481]
MSSEREEGTTHRGPAEPGTASVRGDRVRFRLLAITPPAQDPTARHVDAWLRTGVPASQMAALLRRPDESLAAALSRIDQDATWRRFVGACTEAGVWLLASASAREVTLAAEPLARSPACGVQLRGDPSPAEIHRAREALGGDDGALIGRSVHGAPPFDSPHGADYTCLAPVFPPRTDQAGRTKAAIGLSTLRRWTALRHAGQVFALGGVDATNASACLNAGAYGLAGIRAFFGDVGQVREDVAALHQALAAAPRHADAKSIPRL